jgi:hypothetical protein
MPFGSKAAFSARIRSSSTAGLTRASAALQLADAVFGGNRAAELKRDLVDGLRQFLPSRQELHLGHADRLGDIVVVVAVAEMADRQRPRPGTEAEYPRLGTGNKGGDGDDRHVMSFLMLPPSRELRAGIAQHMRRANDGRKALNDLGLG